MKELNAHKKSQLDDFMAKPTEEISIRAWVLRWFQTGFIALFLATIIMTLLVNNGSRRTLYLGLLTILLLLLIIAYILNIRGKYNDSSWLTIIIMLIAPWAAILLDKTIAGGDIVPLIYLALSIQLCSIFLSERITIIIAVVQLGALSVFILVSSELVRLNWPSLIAFIVFTAIIGIVSSFTNQKYIRKIEAQRLKLLENEVKLKDLSDARYRRLFESTKDGIMLLDFETGIIQDFNPFLINFLGGTKDQLLKKVIWDIGFFKDIVNSKENFSELQKNEYIRYDNVQIQTADGRLVNVEVVSNVYLVGDTKVIQCNIRDITERSQAEAKIIHLATFPNLNPDPIIELGLDETIQYCNPATMNMFPDIKSLGVRHPFLLNLPNITTPLSAQKSDAMMREIMVGDSFYAQTFQFVKTTNVIRIYSHDITELKKSLEALRDSEKKYSSYIENAPDGVFVSDETGQYLEVNKVAAIITGYSRDELLHMKISDILAPESLKDGVNHFKRLLENGESSGSMQYKNKDGSIRWWTVNAVKLSYNRFLGFVKDITENKILDEEIKKSHINLEKMNSMLSLRLEQSVNALSKLGELRDVYTAGHQKKVSELACAIAIEMKLSDTEIHNILFGALMHDIGKIYIASEILNKPGKISSLEYQIMQTHVEHSYEVVKEIDFPRQVLEMIQQHHERLDGSGYPQKLIGEQITIEGRILAVSDVVEAMSSHRPYRAALGIDAALNEISMYRGIRFDCDVVDTCIRLFREKGYEFTV